MRIPFIILIRGGGLAIRGLGHGVMILSLQKPGAAATATAAAAAGAGGVLGASSIVLVAFASALVVPAGHTFLL